jgi:hypothetical protein
LAGGLPRLDGLAVPAAGLGLGGSPHVGAGQPASDMPGDGGGAPARLDVPAGSSLVERSFADAAGEQEQRKHHPVRVAAGDADAWQDAFQARPGWGDWSVADLDSVFARRGGFRD